MAQGISTRGRSQSNTKCKGLYFVWLELSGGEDFEDGNFHLGIGSAAALEKIDEDLDGSPGDALAVLHGDEHPFCGMDRPLPLVVASDEVAAPGRNPGRRSKKLLDRHLVGFDEGQRPGEGGEGAAGGNLVAGIFDKRRNGRRIAHVSYNGKAWKIPD